MKKLALATCFNYNATSEFWANAANAGFTDAEIDTQGAVTDPHEIIAQSELVMKELKMGGLAPTSVHLPFSPYWDISQKDAAFREEVLAKLETILAWMGSEGIPIAVLHPSYEPIDPIDRPVRLAIAAESVARLGNAAAKHGVMIALENLPRTCLGNSADEMLVLIGNQDSVRICFDVNHLLKETHREFVEKTGNYIITTHLSDYDFTDERHWAPGEGRIDWAELRKLLEGVHYGGRWLFEVGAENCCPSLGRAITAKELANRFYDAIR